MASNRAKFVVRTLAGKLAKVAVLVAAAILDPSGAVGQAIRAAIAALSTGKVTRSSIAQGFTVAVTPASGPYEDDQDKATFTFVDDNGQYETYRIPAPHEAIFTDGETLNLANAQVIAFADWVTTNCKSVSGAAIVKLIKGQRIRLKRGHRA